MFSNASIYKIIYLLSTASIVWANPDLLFAQNWKSTKSQIKNSPLTSNQSYPLALKAEASQNSISLSKNSTIIQVRTNSPSTRATIAELKKRLEQPPTDSQTLADSQVSIDLLAKWAQSNNFSQQKQALLVMGSAFSALDPSESNEFQRQLFDYIATTLSQIVLSADNESIIRRTALYILIRRGSQSLEPDHIQPDVTTLVLKKLKEISNSSPPLPPLLMRTTNFAIEKLNINKPVTSAVSSTDRQTGTNSITRATTGKEELSELLKFQPVAAGDLPTVGHGTGTAVDMPGVALTRPFDPDRDSYSPKRILRGDQRKKSTTDSVRKARASGASAATGAYGIQFKPAVVPK